jgi:hypothetical protein
MRHRPGYDGYGLCLRDRRPVRCAFDKLRDNRASATPFRLTHVEDLQRWLLYAPMKFGHSLIYYEQCSRASG